MFKELNIMQGVSMIQNPDVYFNVMTHSSSEVEPPVQQVNQMYHGSINISLNRIYLNSNDQSYKAEIQDIKSIETQMNKKLLLIHFWDQDMVIACKQQSQLVALRDLISLSRNYLTSRNYMFLGSSTING